MKKINNNEKGIALIYIIIIIAVLACFVGGMIWFFNNKNSSSNRRQAENETNYKMEEKNNNEKKTGRDEIAAETENPNFVMRVREKFNDEKYGKVYTGTVESGELNVGDKIDIFGLDEKNGTIAKIKKLIIESSLKEIQKATKQQEIAVVLEGGDNIEIVRGCTFATPNTMINSKTFKAKIYVFSQNEYSRAESFTDGYRPQFYFGATDTTGQISLLNQIQEIKPGESNEVSVELSFYTAMRIGTNFRIRFGGEEIGIGKVEEVN